MSLPLLQTSPSVQLEITARRELEASVVLAPVASNALRRRPTGLWAKAGYRRNDWSVAINQAQQMHLVAQADQVFNWAVEDSDPSGLFNLAALPTRVTIAETGSYFPRAQAMVSLVGGTAASGSALMWLRKNGLSFVAGSLVTMQATGGAFFPGNVTTYVDLVAGDYLEVCWRWLAFGTLTATSATVAAAGETRWQGWRMAATR